MNYPFKDKFTATPQQDAEGFTVMDARCVGCAPTDMCPRSGHCERYMSPIRETHGIAAHMVKPIRYDKAGFINSTVDAMMQQVRSYKNPEGWREVDGVELPHITWGRAS